MINEFIRLIAGTVIGGFATFLNINQNATFEQTMSRHLGIANGVLALIIGFSTLVFMYYQIVKIKRELKAKYSKKKND